MSTLKLSPTDGVPVEVDHIVPLCGDGVSGLLKLRRLLPHVFLGSVASQQRICLSVSRSEIRFFSVNVDSLPIRV